MAPAVPRFQSQRPGRFPATNKRTSARSEASPASIRVAFSRDSSYSSATISSSLSTAESINSIIFRQPSILGHEEERRSFPRGLTILEPRPIVYWSSMEERMGSKA